MASALHTLESTRFAASAVSNSFQDMQSASHHPCAYGFTLPETYVTEVLEPSEQR